MTHEQPDTPQEPDYKSKTLHLQESLRLAESQIEEHNKTFEKIERKAVLLATLCIAITGYLLSWDIWDKENWMVIEIYWIIKISLIIILGMLAIAAWIASSVLFIRRFKTPGVNPTYLMWEYFNYDFNKMAIDLLKEYKKRCDFNENVLKEKTNDFNKSLCWGKSGIIFACIWTFITFAVVSII